MEHYECREGQTVMGKGLFLKRPTVQLEVSEEAGSPELRLSPS